MNYIVKIVEGKPVIYGMAGKDGKDAPVYVFEDEESFNAAFEAGMIPVGAVVIKTYDGEESAGWTFDDTLSEESENAPQNKVVTIHIKKQDEELEILSQIANGTYEGRNLADVFDSEIAKYTNAWEWMKDRIRTVQFQGLYVSDYIPINTSDGEEVKPQIAGIDTHYRTYDTALGHHIDFISKDCLSQPMQWRTTADNNGSSENGTPYMLSNIKAQLNGTVFEKLPTALKNVISNKVALMETRYSDSGKLEESNSWSWADLGKLCIPTEYEVTGSVLFGGAWSQGQALQYPIFKNSWRNRIKNAGSGGNRCNWSLATVKKGNTFDCCLIDHAGYGGFWIANSNQYVPVCFRISE